MLNKTYNPEDVEENWRTQLVNAAIDSSHDGTKPLLTMVMPPPNVTGNLHIGHVLTFSLQDVWIKFWQMRGADVWAQPGLDHAGIATQMLLERSLTERGLSKHTLGREKFLEEAFSWKEKTGGAILEQLKILGVSARWDQTRFTLDPDINKIVRQVFKEFYHQKLIFKQERLVHWDPQLKTALSDLEVQLKEVPGKLWTLRYPLVDSAKEFIDISTTRPETMFGDMAVAVHPKDCRYQKLLGRYVHLPLTDRQIPIIADDRVEPDKGTGAVKITPAHDFLDFEIGRTHYLSYITILDKTGRLNQSVPEAFQGLTCSEARTKALEKLKESGVLLREEDIRHHVPFGERSGERLQARLTKQWYLDVKPLAKEALKALDREKFTFVPERYGKTYRNWLENIEPWCISRQLWWGHQIPAWYGPDDHIFVGESEKDVQLQAQDYYGEPKPLIPDPDVLDTWFSSALWPLITLGWPEKPEQFKKHYPTAVLMTGFDIIFFWVARMVMMGMHFADDVPFKVVYIHGLVRDAERQKMSKTKGNVVDPLKIIATYGTDALRFSLTSLSSPGHDIAFNEKQVEASRNFVTKLWNAVRFALLNEISYPEEFDPETSEFCLNRWIIHEVVRLVTTVTRASEAFLFYEAASSLYHFVWHCFCDWYMELSKPILTDPQHPSHRETRATMGWVLDILLKLLYPHIPFASSELWKHFRPKAAPLSQQSWPFLKPLEKIGEDAQRVLKELEATLSFPDDMKDIQRLISWVTEVRRLRALLNLPAAKKIQLDIFGISEENRAWFETYRIFLSHAAKIENLSFKDGHPERTARTIRGVVQNISFVIPLGKVIDLETERKHLVQKRDKLLKEKESLDQRLQNPSFQKKAPTKLVEELQGRLANVNEDLQSLSNLLEDSA
jgi:valyl-tRNA synthetase